MKSLPFCLKNIREAEKKEREDEIDLFNKLFIDIIVVPNKKKIPLVN